MIFMKHRTRPWPFALAGIIACLALVAGPPAANAGSPKLTRTVVQNMVKEWHQVDPKVKGFRLHAYKRMAVATATSPLVIQVPMTKRNGRRCHYSMTVELHPPYDGTMWAVELQQLLTPGVTGCPRPGFFNMQMAYIDLRPSGS